MKHNQRDHYRSIVRQAGRLTETENAVPALAIKFNRVNLKRLTRSTANSVENNDIILQDRIALPFEPSECHINELKHASNVSDGGRECFRRQFGWPQP